MTVSVSIAARRLSAEANAFLAGAEPGKEPFKSLNRLLDVSTVLLTLRQHSGESGSR
jgi:hypothetical protein